jgi:hypothetical protein
MTMHAVVLLRGAGAGAGAGAGLSLDWIHPSTLLLARCSCTEYRAWPWPMDDKAAGASGRLLVGSFSDGRGSEPIPLDRSLSEIKHYVLVVRKECHESQCDNFAVLLRSSSCAVSLDASDFDGSRPSHG